MAVPSNKDNSKKGEVREMFDSIAVTYDFLNHFLSFGIDVRWRKKLIRKLKKYHPNHVVDIATGTADLAIMAAKSGINRVTGLDLSENMIEVGNQKVLKNNLHDRIGLKQGDAEEIHFPDNYFDAAMVAFGVRNFENLEKGIQEINRVLKQDSPFFILEFSTPDRFPVKQLYKFYSKSVLPFWGRIISKDKRAYSYLPESIAEFPYGKDFIAILNKCGFEKTYYYPLTFQIATIYVGHKKGLPNNNS